MDLNGLSSKVDNLCTDTTNGTSSMLGFSTKQGGIFSTSNPIFYVIIGFVAITILLLVVRPKFITVKIEKDDGKTVHKLSYKRAGITIAVLALIAGGAIFALYLKNKKKPMLV